MGLTLTALAMMALFGITPNVLDVSASKGCCPESKDGSHANAACGSGSKVECKAFNKDFKCVKQPDVPPPCPACP